MLDPFMLFKLPLMAWRLWVRYVPPKYLIAGMGASTFAVVIYGCVEGGNW